MIIQRTEKSITDITKHEIVAKLIMETMAVKDISRLPCITALSESVKRICPELESPVDKLVRHLATFLSNLASDEEHQKDDLIKLRIEESVMDFSKEADRLLPSPKLLQVVESWNHHHGHVHQKQPKKAIYSAILFEKVLECLNLECNKITPPEAKLIAGSLYEDKVFERILAQAEAETETEVDSEQFSLSLQSSQPNDHIYSQEFTKNAQQEMAEDIPINTELPDPDSLQLDNPPPYVQDLHAPGDPCDRHLTVPSSSSPRSHKINKDILEDRINPILQNHETDNVVQLAQSSVRESDSDEPSCGLMTRFDTSSKSKLSAKQKSLNQNRSDSDDRDCSLITRLNKGTQRRLIAQKESTIQNPSYPDKLECNVMAQLNRSKSRLSEWNESVNPNLSGTDEFDYNLITESNTTSNSRINAQRLFVNQDESDADTSDCEKNPEFRFLTPTLFKKNENDKAMTKSQKFVYLSDMESDDSSVRTMSVIGSQQNDPNWGSHKKNVWNPVKKFSKRPHKQKVIVLSDDEVEYGTHVVGGEENYQNRLKKNPKISHKKNDFSLSNNEDSDTHVDICGGNDQNGWQQNPKGSKKKIVVLSDSEENSDTHVDVGEENDQNRSVTRTIPMEKTTKRRRLERTVKLYRSPNISIDDFQLTRRPTSVVSNTPFHQGTTRKPASKKTPQAGKKSNKEKKCKQCSKTYKTVIAMRRHIFLKHTAPISSTPDSDVS